MEESVRFVGHLDVPRIVGHEKSAAIQYHQRLGHSSSLETSLIHSNTRGQCLSTCHCFPHQEWGKSPMEAPGERRRADEWDQS